MALCGILLQQLLLRALILAAVAVPETINSSCNSTCGSVSIPCPFGTSEHCFLDPSFLVTCNYTFNPPKPYLGTVNAEVLNISHGGNLRVATNVARQCYNESFPVRSTFRSGRFRISSLRNKLIVVGCNTLGVLKGTAAGKNFTIGCISYCDTINSVVSGTCRGVGCCKSFLPPQITSFELLVGSLDNDSEVQRFNPCNFAFVVEEDAYQFSSSHIASLHNKTVPTVLDWAVGDKTCQEAKKNKKSYVCNSRNSECSYPTNTPGYLCRCSKGYAGNPYLPDSCQDIDECKISNPCGENTCSNVEGSFRCICPEGYEDKGRKNGTLCSRKSSNSGSTAIELGIAGGFLLLFIGSFWIYWGLKHRKLIKLKEIFFQQNGGLMLQKQLSNYTGSEESTKIFGAEELRRATKNYDKSMILGQGGNGTVYKGVLPGSKVVAIKKSKVVDHSQVKQFVNEVLLLTRINHRNVVKLLGCCLETEVPLLVYEFISNGTLFKHIHDQNCSSSLSWEKRLKIAIETSGVLAYLHSEISMPIIHRDVKSTNILLDDNMTVKVADFGVSRLVSLDKTKVTTLVYGTFGYLDPEYLQTGQLSEKSDVYSFGVVLVELLTSKEIIFLDDTGSDTNLAFYFVLSMKEDHLFHILDNHLVNEDNIEELKKVANVAQRCLSVRGENRPSMKEVAMELEGLRIVKMHTQGETSLSTEEVEHSHIGLTESFSIDVGAGCSSTNKTVATW